MLGLVKCMMGCLHRRIRLCTSQGGQPAGISVVHGLGDYFEPIFPEIDAGIFNALNLPSVRGSGRFPIVRRGVSRTLRTVTRGNFFMMDDLGALPDRLVVPELGVDAEYWQASALLASLVWVYRPDVEKEVLGMASDWDLPKSYLAVHVRRGDKNTESRYTNLDAYVAAIDRARPQACAVVVASDDASAAAELARLLPSRFRVTTCSDEGTRGYGRKEFNGLPPSERFRQVKRFLAEFEVLRRGEIFVGSTGSNVTSLIEVIRAGDGVLQVE